MFYKHILDLYRGVFPGEGRVSPGSLRMGGEISSGLERSMPFMLSGEALELVYDLAPENYSEGLILERTRGFRLPYPHTWVEYEHRNGEVSERIGALLRGGGDKPLTALPFIEADGMFIEPFCMLIIDHAKNSVSLGINTLTFRDHIDFLLERGYEQSGADRKMEEGKRIFSDLAAMSAIFLRDAIDLMGAKNAPVDGRREPLMSRQERRALARKGEKPPEAATEATRIVLNAEGKAHLTAMRNASDGRPRRAHWVRGHLMNSPTKGPVWRSAHVRGFGDPVMTPRFVTTTPEVSEPDDGMPSP